LGYVTHGLLDASTSYGTMLLWPFSGDRLSWSIVPIIGPLLTLPLIILIVVSGLRQNRIIARVAMGWVSLYLSIGALQHSAAISLAREISASRGHTPIRIEVKPSFANILVWKTIYEADQYFYVDAVRVGAGARVFHGTSIPKLDIARDLPWLDPNSQQARDIRRFGVFSMNFLAVDPNNPNRIRDIRYSFVPNEISLLWSINISPDAQSNEHAIYKTHRGNARESLARF
jgi:inner membrane protein